MPITALQVRLIHVAAHAAGMNDAAYRMVLSNVAGVASCKELDQPGFEDCMAVFEAGGFSDPDQPNDYWRMKSEKRNTYANDRIVRKIQTMASECRYPIAGLCERFSEGRTMHPGKLRPIEAHNLIEAMKSMLRREEEPASLPHASHGVPGVLA